MSKKLPVASQLETVRAILTESSRPRLVPIRNTFVQLGRRGVDARPGPLAEIVRRGRDNALDQFLLLIAWASAPPFDVRRDSRVWARALGLSLDTAGRATVSRNWRFLRDDVRVIKTRRRGREIEATLLREDGSGKEYAHPGSARDASYLKLPFAYWEDGYFKSLHLPGKALLLIALSLPRAFPLPVERAPQWYGLSASTTERGLSELRKANLLSMRKTYKKAPLAPKGYSAVNVYTLRKPFQSRPRAEAADDLPPDEEVAL